MLVIATPLAGNDMLCASVSQGYSEHVRALSHAMDVVQVVSYSGSHVHARNRLTVALLRDYPDMTHTLWWDADQWPESRDLAARMLATGEELISAPTTTKERNPKFTHRPLSGAQPIGDLLEIAVTGFGFTITSRRCLEAVSSAAEVYHESDGEVPNVFGHLYADVGDGKRQLLGEDFSFCTRWRDLGGRVSLLLNAGIMHHAGVRDYNVLDIPGAYSEAPPAMAVE